jgi:hypothetical protein
MGEETSPYQNPLYNLRDWGTPPSFTQAVASFKIATFVLEETQG